MLPLSHQDKPNFANARKVPLALARQKKTAYKYRVAVCLCLVAHPISSLIRKLLPGQPNFVEPLTITAALLISLLWAFQKKRQRKLSANTAKPILSWVFFLSIYAAIAIVIDPRISLMAFCIRIFPIGMSLLAFRAIEDKKDIKVLAHTLGIIAILLMPFAISIIFFGDKFLPGFLRQIELLEEAKQFRHGMYRFAGIYNSPATLSMSMMASFFCSLSLVDKLKKRNYLFIVYALCSLFLIFVSTRRGVLFAVLIGLQVYIVLHNVKKKFLIPTLFITSLIAFYVAFVPDRTSRIPSYSIKNPESKSVGILNYFNKEIGFIKEADFHQRFQGVFWPFTMRWARKTPLGTYLGFGGREAIVFNGPRYDNMTMETGSALLIAETGIIGALLFPAILLLLWRKIYRLSKKNRHQHEIIILLTYSILFAILFYTKEAAPMISPVTGHLFFWSVFGICAALIRADREMNKDLSQRTINPNETSPPQVEGFMIN